MKYSIILLFEHDHKDFAQFIKNLYQVFSSRQEPFEIIIIANGTGRFLGNHLLEFQGFNHKLRAFEFNTKTTQAVCLEAGVKESSGDIIVVCGTTQQLTNESLIQLLDSFADDTDIINPWRQHRVDPWLKRFQSKLFNTIVSKISKSDFHDLGCTIRVCSREVLEDTEIYGNMYRYLPLLAARRGFKTKEIKCKAYQVLGQTSFYSSYDYVTRLIDILNLYFTTKFTRRPLLFFNAIGLAFMLIGLTMMSYVFFEKFLMGQPIGDRTILLLAVFFLVLGVQTASVGLLGEIITFIHGRQKQEYVIEKII